jgi:hypothetical protein
MLKWFRVEQLHFVITYEARGRSSVVEREPFKFEAEGSIPSALTYFSSQSFAQYTCFSCLFPVGINLIFACDVPV